MNNIALTAFVKESNMIEGIYRLPTADELSATAEFLSRADITVLALQTLVGVYAPGHTLRDRKGLDVRVGSYIAPPGGPAIRERLGVLLDHANAGADAYLVHCDYEMLHPFTDGNGRSGRALWAWTMSRNGGDPFALPFLHRFYYQTLEHARHV
jgi:hypothetical protein